mmetsp:Transcript_93091/g.279267  ORF Transcript_93091/g.279267 Transcript_93091/m.279267 type:complete len:410 (-) Transcript_93091:60-1289(-)
MSSIVQHPLAKFVPARWRPLDASQCVRDVVDGQIVQGLNPRSLTRIPRTANSVRPNGGNAERPPPHLSRLRAGAGHVHAPPERFPDNRHGRGPTRKILETVEMFLVGRFLVALAELLEHRAVVCIDVAATALVLRRRGEREASTALRARSRLSRPNADAIARQLRAKPAWTRQLCDALLVGTDQHELQADCTALPPDLQQRRVARHVVQLAGHHSHFPKVHLRRAVEDEEVGVRVRQGAREQSVCSEHVRVLLCVDEPEVCSRYRKEPIAVLFLPSWLVLLPIVAGEDAAPPVIIDDVVHVDRTVTMAEVHLWCVAFLHVIANPRSCSPSPCKGLQRLVLFDEVAVPRAGVKLLCAAPKAKRRESERHEAAANDGVGVVGVHDEDDVAHAGCKGCHQRPKRPGAREVIE